MTTLRCWIVNTAFLPLSNFEHSSAYLHWYTHNYAFTYSFNPVNPTIYRSIDKVICCPLKWSQHQHTLAHFLDSKSCDSKHFTLFLGIIFFFNIVFVTEKYIMGKSEYNDTERGERLTLNVITSAKSIIWRMSMFIPWLSIVYFISSIIHFLAASMPSVCCTSMIWLLVVLRPSTPSMPITSWRPELKRSMTYIKNKWKNSFQHIAKQKMTTIWILSIIVWCCARCHMT